MARDAVTEYLRLVMRLEIAASLTSRRAELNQCTNNPLERGQVLKEEQTGVYDMLTLCLPGAHQILASYTTLQCYSKQGEPSVLMLSS